MELAGLEPATSWVRFRSAAFVTRSRSGFPASPAVRNPSDTPRLPAGFGDVTRFIPKTASSS
jgi:hypothetical protein